MQPHLVAYVPLIDVKRTLKCSDSDASGPRSHDLAVQYVVTPRPCKTEKKDARMLLNWTGSQKQASILEVHTAKFDLLPYMELSLENFTAHRAASQ